MKVSVCITVYNEEDNIDKLLSSLLKQSKKPDEIVIVDGGSTDKTVEKIKYFKKRNKLIIRFFEKKCSRSEGRNISVRKAKNDIIAMTDAGCAAKADWLEKIAKPFKKSSTEVVAGFYEMVGNMTGVTPVKKTSLQEAASVFLGVLPEDFNNDFLPSTRSIAFRSGVWKKVGGFPEDLSDTAEDTIFNYKLLNNSVKVVRVKDARVEWGMPSTLGDIVHKMYSYAKGDSKAGVIIFPSKGMTSHNIKIILKLIRYIFFILLLLLGLIISLYFIYIFLLLLLLYSLYSFYKVYKKTKDIIAGLWGIVLQYTSDITGISGFIKGKLS